MNIQELKTDRQALLDSIKNLEERVTASRKEIALIDKEIRLLAPKPKWAIVEVKPAEYGLAKHLGGVRFKRECVNYDELKELNMAPSNQTDWSVNYVYVDGRLTYDGGGTVFIKDPAKKGQSFSNFDINIEITLEEWEAMKQGDIPERLLGE